MSHINIKSGGCSWKMHEKLIQNFKHIKINNVKDWDFKILISGDGMTRTGKSTIAAQAAQYFDPSFYRNWKERMIFDGQKLVKTAYEIGSNKALVYDEAREGLDSKKQMEKYTKNLLDFFSQCGNLNHIIIIVLPDFFELPKSIALTQSICLINCYARHGFQRGYFEFYNRKDKRYLFIKGSKYLDYSQQKPSFKGTFTKYFPMDREEYETEKNIQLKGIREKEGVSLIRKAAEIHRNRMIISVSKFIELGFKPKDLAILFACDKATIYNSYINPITKK